MKAVVMAGGAGSRLRPITIERPKPMITIVNRPALGHILNLLKRHDVNEVIITLQYLAAVVQDYFGDGSNMGMKITYCVEEDPLGTAGSVKNVQSLLDDTFLVISGDAVTDFNLRDIVAFHRRKKAQATLTLYRVSNPMEYGVIVTDPEGYIIQFLEKPDWGEIISDTVNTGIYVLEPEVLDWIPDGQAYDFSTELFPQLLAQRIPMAGYVAEGYWCDVGNLNSLRAATAAILEGKVAGVHLGRSVGKDIWTGGEVEIALSATLRGPIYLGKSVKVRDGAVIQGPTVIRDYTIVEERAQIDRSIIWRNCYIGKGAEVQGAVVLRHCSLKAKSVVYEGVVIGDGSIVGEGAIIHPSVKIWPGKEIEPGATIKNSVIWGAQGRRVLFGPQGVTGMVNVDFTPEFSARLGAAFGSTLPKGSVVTFNRDPHRSPRMLKRGAIAGLPSAGVQVADLGVQPLPVARYFTRVSDAIGGMHVHLSPFDEMVVNMRFMDSGGLDIGKEAARQIERVFFREDFRRVYTDEIGTISYASKVQETYTEGFLQAINVEAIREAKFNPVVDYAGAPAATILPAILNALGCDVVALNATIDETKMSIPYEDFQDDLRQLQTISKALGASLGVRIAASGETVFVVDDAGQSLSGVDLCAAMTELSLTAHPGKTVALAVDLPRMFEEIAARHSGNVIRTRLDARTLMPSMLTETIVMAGDGRGNFIFPDFQPCIDGLMALARLLEFLATQGRRLSDVVADLPPYYLAKAPVYCVWEMKGRVMRMLNQRFENRLASSVNGVKIALNEREWVLVLPSQDQPYIEVVAEAESLAAAEALVEEYVQLVKALQAEEDE